MAGITQEAAEKILEADFTNIVRNEPWQES